MSKQTPYISPKLSPLLRKYISPNYEDVDLLRRLISFDDEFAYVVNKEILDEKNSNICIHPYQFNIILSEFLDDFDFNNLLNSCYLPEHYNFWYQKYFKIITKKEELNINVLPAIDSYESFAKNIITDCKERFLFCPVSLTHLVLSFKKKYNENTINEVTNSEANNKTFNESFLDKNINIKIENHASFLLVDTYQGKAYYMDPAQRLLERVIEETGDYSYYYELFTSIIKYKSEMMLKSLYPFLGIKRVEVLDVDAPQSITNDENCIFWSLLICDIMLKNLKEDKIFNPKLFIKGLLKKYNTKEKLERVIRRYTSYIYESSKSGNIPGYFYRNLLKNTYINRNYV
jgi:hypothetical protein